MKEEKTLIQLAFRFESNPLTQKEQFGLGLLATFFLAMSILFFIVPSILG
ncbi:MAG: hypothetical protein IPK10_03450 [Bacteroidetes bacterium]|nr:hypothetical protein [Bacteroidota bacterium]